MKSKLGSFLITALAGLLLVYSAARSLDFISMTLPADKQILAYFGLAALDGGLVFWLLNFLSGSHGWQRTIAFLMIVVDFLGACTMFTMDTLLNSGKAGLTAQLDQNQVQTAVIALSLIIAVNVGATVAYHILNPENLRRMAEEEARDKIETMALREIQANAGQLATELAPQISKAWMEQERQNYGLLLRGRKKAAALPENIQPALTFQASETTQVIPLPEKEALPEIANPTAPAKKSRSQKAS